MPTENIFKYGKYFLAEWENLLCPAVLMKNAASFSMKTAYVDIHDNSVEMLSCTVLFLFLAIEITFNRNNIIKTGEQVLWKMFFSRLFPMHTQYGDRFSES